MRHKIGIALAIVMAGVLFFAGCWGYLRLLRPPAPPVPLSGLPAGGGSLLSFHGVLGALAAVAATGLLAGLLIAVPWVSPIAAGLPGLLLTGWTVLYLASVRHAVELIPLKAYPSGAGFEAMLFNGTLGALGLAMIIPMFVPSRWRTPNAEAELDLPAFGESVYETQPTEPREPLESVGAPEPVMSGSAAPWDPISRAPAPHR